MLCLVPAATLPAQGFHTPAQFLEIIQSSELSYNISEVDTFVAPSWPMPVNDSYTYQVEKEDGYGIARFNPEPRVSALLGMGEEVFRKREFEKAQGYFEQVVSRDPEFAVAHVYLGQCAYNLGRHDSAEKHLRHAIRLNYWDYLAHLSLAHVLARKPDQSGAMQEAGLAYVLNPNDPLVLRETRRVFEACGRGFREFVFFPNYQLQQTGSEVQIHMSMPWFMYALCKAVWKYEPGYRRSMEPVGSRDFNLLEEKECLLNLAASLHDMKRKQLRDPALAALTDAMEARMLEQFIVVELWLRREPLIVYTQPKEMLPGLAEYVVNIRGVKL